MKNQKAKLKLTELKVESFVTSLKENEKETVQGGTPSAVALAPATPGAVAASPVALSVAASVSVVGSLVYSAIKVFGGSGWLGHCPPVAPEEPQNCPSGPACPYSQPPASCRLNGSGCA